MRYKPTKTLKIQPEIEARSLSYTQIFFWNCYVAPISGIVNF